MASEMPKMCPSVCTNMGQLASILGKPRAGGLADLQDADNLVDDHEYPDHGDSEPEEGKDNASAMPSIGEEAIGEKGEEKPDGKGGERIVPDEFIGCRTQSDQLAVSRSCEKGEAAHPEEPSRRRRVRARIASPSMSS